MNTDKILNEGDADQFLRGIGLRVDKDVVCKVLDALTGKSKASMYELYSLNPRRDGTSRTPICGKGTTDKIKKLFENGEFQPYIQYREEVSRRSEESNRQLDEEDRLAEKESIREKEAKQIEHVSSLQELVREFLDSVGDPADYDDLDVEKARNSLWQAFRRITGDARWPMLAAHLADYADAFYNMTERLVPPEVAKARATPGKPVVTNYSTDDMIEIIDEAYAFISRSPLNLIAEMADTEEWECSGLKPWCQWCPIQMSEPRNS